jgi:hypothetical protein
VVCPQKRIGVRAVGKQNQRAKKEEEALHGNPQPRPTNLMN